MQQCVNLCANQFIVRHQFHGWNLIDDQYVCIYGVMLRELCDLHRLQKKFYKTKKKQKICNCVDMKQYSWVGWWWDTNEAMCAHFDIKKILNTINFFKKVLRKILVLTQIIEFNRETIWRKEIAEEITQAKLKNLSWWCF